MADIMVYKPFRLNMGGKLIKFETGLNTGIPREQAEHWWTKLHASPVGSKDDIAVNKKRPEAISTKMAVPTTPRKRA